MPHMLEVAAWRHGHYGVAAPPYSPRFSTFPAACHLLLACASWYILALSFQLPSKGLGSELCKFGVIWTLSYRRIRCLFTIYAVIHILFRNIRTILQNVMTASTITRTSQVGMQGQGARRSCIRA